MRLDVYLANKYPEHSRSVWAKLIKRGDVKVNDAVIESPSRNVGDKDVVMATDFSEAKTSMELPVIFEDDNVIVINKPAGVLTHSKGALNDEFTVSDFIRERVAKSDLPENNRFGIVHRLDRDTSGVIIGAKNEATRKMLQKQFQDRKTKKTYQALVNITSVGLKTLDKHTEDFAIDLPIARNPKKPSQFKVESRGKDAITDVKVDKLFDNKTALLELKPKTGRTHQLRVHLAYVGLPIVGDFVYNANGKEFPRMMLHAKRLEITIPEGDRKVFKAELPNEFAKN
jgi:pseudouridine synthase, RluA family